MQIRIQTKSSPDEVEMFFPPTNQELNHRDWIHIQ